LQKYKILGVEWRKKGLTFAEGETFFTVKMFFCILANDFIGIFLDD
jgi:hypothetical protein